MNTDFPKPGRNEFARAVEKGYRTIFDLANILANHFNCNDVTSRLYGVAIALREATKEHKSDPEQHPEERCERCLGRNMIWFTASETWNRVTNGKYSILCPICFTELAEAIGIKPTSWQLIPEEPCE
jgi:hypothetical protein